jgi:diguanylate cyclase (GGDEF)-like protein
MAEAAVSRRRSGVRGTKAPEVLLTPAEQEFAVARQAFLEALPIAAAIVAIGPTGDLAIQIANRNFRRTSGWEEEVAGAGLSAVPLLTASGIGDKIRHFMAGEEASRDFEASDGQAVGGRIFSIRFSRMTAVEALGPRTMVTLIDRTAQVETERSLRAEMLRDSLTGLPNRTAFNESVEAALEDPAFQPGCCAVLVLDMTRFSRVNECVGALAGDELLITFARRLFSALRAHDVLARTGGDEFGVLMRLERGLEDALQAAERIRAALSEPFRLSELEIRVDCAIGCALLSGSEALSEEVLRNAQFALKRAKASGMVQIYEPNQARAARRRFSIETELRRAVEGGDLHLAFQPVIDLGTGAVAGFEALARWDHPSRGAISPTEFIPVAEESGLIVPLGRWAIEAALETLAAWGRASGAALPATMAVNLSAVQIGRDDVAAQVESALSRSGVAGPRLTLELTESAIIQDPARAAKVLEELKGHDVRVAMDDFGTGYTSLAYLQRLPIDLLKIDRSFVSGMLADADSVAIVRAVLSLANALGMATTAEGIDSPGTAAALTEMGCCYGQGFHFARPLTAEAAYDHWLSRSA